MLRFNKRDIVIFGNCHEVVMYLSQLPISFPELTNSPPGAPVSVVIPTLTGEMNLPWVIRRLPSYAYEFVIAGGRSHDHTVDLARALWVDVVGVDEQRNGKDVAVHAGFAAASGDSIVFRSDYSDLWYGFIAFRRQCLEVLNWFSRPPATCAGLGSPTSLQPS